MNQSEGPAGTEKINTDIITLTRWLTEEQRKHKEATGDFTYVGRRRCCACTWADFTISLDCCAMRSNSPSSRSRTTFEERP